MKLNELHPTEGSTTKYFRVGRGIGSGNGKTSGRGHKGQNARSGGGVRPGFEGGQMPFTRRMPKRGFVNIFAKEYAVINLATLNNYENDTVIDLELLINDGIIRKPFNGLKILGTGELDKKLIVKAVKFTKSAEEKINALGGKAEVV